MMKGVILAGGLGTRLLPCTRITNKHLLPVYDKPMIHFPIQTLVNADMTDILIVTGGNYAGHFLQLLGNGKAFGLKELHYTYQEGEGGIADALRLAEDFADGERFCVVLGDNLIQRSIRPAVEAYERQERGARILLKEVEDPQRFGCPVMDGERIVRIEEKPRRPQSQYAVTGIYFYDHQVFEMIRQLKPSERGELEISDVNNMYLEKDQLEWSILDGWWTDAGTFPSLLRAANLVARGGANLLDDR
jgi:glucose-1-phosphate thymidylyltransferase